MYSDLTPWYFCLCSAWVERKGLSPWDDGLLVTHIKSKLFETPDMYFFTLFFSTLHCDYLGEKGAHFPLSFVARFFSLSSLLQAHRHSVESLLYNCRWADGEFTHNFKAALLHFYNRVNISFSHSPILSFHNPYSICTIGNQLLHMHQKVDQLWKLIKGTLSLTLQYSNIM